MNHEDPRLIKDVLTFAWQHSLSCVNNLSTGSGERVSVVRPGIRGKSGQPEFTDAEIVIGGRSIVGSIAVHVHSSDWNIDRRNQNSNYDSVILNIVADDDRIIRKLDDSVLSCAVMVFPEKLLRTLKAIMAGSENCACGKFVKRYMEDVEIKNGCTRLAIERMERKYNDIMKIHSHTDMCWPETFHIMMFRTMGLGSNKEVYMSLARNIPYSVLCRERGDVKKLESMILGVAGLLDNRVYDDYKTQLCRVFEEMRAKYDLKVLEYCEWTDKGVRPYNFAPKRLAQLSKLIDSGNFTLETILECKNVREVKKLFDMELSDYWKRSFDFGKRSPSTRQAVGDMTIDIMIINLVSPMMFAYGRETGNEELQERAIDLLYEVKGENNRYTRGWKNHGVPVESGFYSQAFIQLSTEYCINRLCTECFIGIKALKTI